MSTLSLAPLPPLDVQPSHRLIAAVATPARRVNLNGKLATGASSIEAADARRILAGGVTNSANVRPFAARSFGKIVPLRELLLHARWSHTAARTMSALRVRVLGRLAAAAASDLADALQHVGDAAFPVRGADELWCGLADIDGSVEIAIPTAVAQSDESDAQKQYSGAEVRVPTFGCFDSFLVSIATPGVLSGDGAGSLQVWARGLA